MLIQPNTPLIQTVTQIQQIIQPHTTTNFVDSQGQKVTVQADTKFNVAVNKAGAVIPLMWDQASGEFKAVFKENDIPTGLTDSDIEQAKKIFGEETSGNIVVNSDDVKINSNNTIVANSDRTVLGEKCDRTVVINSPDSKLYECEFGVIKDSREFFGWLSHWLRVDKSRYGEVHNSDHVHMIKSPGAHVDSCEYLKMNKSPSAHFRQSSKTNVMNSSGAQGYEVNGSEIENSHGFTGAYSYKINAKESGDNGVIHSPLTRLIDSPYANPANLEYYQQVQEAYEEELNGVEVPEDFHEASDLRDGAFKSAIEGALEEANIRNAPVSTIEQSPNASADFSLKPTIQRSPNTIVIDSTDAKVIRSPGTTLETCMGKEVINETNSPYYVNMPSNSGDQDADYQQFLYQALA